MPIEICAVSANKGGVGKSTTAVNLATGLASAGWRVLLVDVDPQANTTSMFLGDDEPNIDLYDVITKHEHVRKAILPTRLHGVDLLPSSLSVARLDSELIAMHRREMKVIEALEPVLGDYDAIVADLPPSLSPLVIATLAASTSFLVPTDASRWGKRGVEVLISWVSELREAQVLTADLLGVLLTKVEPNTRISREIRTALHESGLPMFDTYIPKRTGADRMVAGSLVISDENADPDIAEAYANLTVEVIQRINEARARRGRHPREGGE
jgi:chromosome partitioning protein